MALVGNVSEYEFGLANFLEANFEDEDNFEEYDDDSYYEE